MSDEKPKEIGVALFTRKDFLCPNKYTVPGEMDSGDSIAMIANGLLTERSIDVWAVRVDGNAVTKNPNTKDGSYWRASELPAARHWPNAVKAKLIILEDE